MNDFNLNLETFPNLYADPSDTIRTVTDFSDGPSVGSANSVYVCGTGAQWKP